MRDGATDSIAFSTLEYCIILDDNEGEDNEGDIGVCDPPNGVGTVFCRWRCFTGSSFELLSSSLQEDDEDDDEEGV